MAQLQPSVRRQLAILAVARFAEPLGLTSVFPYLPEMIKSFGIKDLDVAKWAGFTGATFSAFQSLTAVPWGRASDKYGRKVMILTGLFSTMCCFLIWGFSTSLTMALTVRAVMGAMNGNVGIIRTMVAEMVPEKALQPTAFAIMPLVWALGSIVGPMFGGVLAQPVQQYPGLFGNSEFLSRFPFALPNMIGCLIFLLSFLTGLLFLRETNPAVKHRPDMGLLLGEKLTRAFCRTQPERRPPTRQHSISFVDDEAQAPLLSSESSRVSYKTLAKPAEHVAEAAPAAMKHVFTSQTVINLVSYTFLALHSVSFDQILPVFLDYRATAPVGMHPHLPFRFTTGFGLDPAQIGIINVIYGFCCGLAQLLLFPLVCRRYGVLNCFKAAVMIFPVVYLLTPYTALLGEGTRLAALLVLLIVKGFAVIVGFPCTTILLTNSCSSLQILGTLNGFATMFSGFGRAIGPALTGAVFTTGARAGFVIAPFWLLAGIAAVGALPTWFIVEGAGPYAASLVGEDEDDEAAATDSDLDALMACGAMVPESSTKHALSKKMARIRRHTREMLAAWPADALPCRCCPFVQVILDRRGMLGSAVWSGWGNRRERTDSTNPTTHGHPFVKSLASTLAIRYTFLYKKPSQLCTHLARCFGTARPFFILSDPANGCA